MEPFTIISAAMGLAKLAPSIIGLFKGKDAEQKAADVVSIAQEITGIGTPQEAVDAVIADPAMAMEFKTRLLDHTLKMREADNTQLDIVNATIRAELSSGDKYNSRWRATFGYLVAASWFIMFLGMVVCMVMIVWTGGPPASPPVDGQQAVATGTNISQAFTALGNMMSSTAMLWTVALSVLGITVSKRSKDKETAAGSPAAPGLLQALLNRKS